LCARTLRKAAVAAGDHILAANQVTQPAQALSDQLWVLDMADRVADDPL
jgi:hypothetical protein